jgi:hypothetical protein
VSYKRLAPFTEGGNNRSGQFETNDSGIPLAARLGKGEESR